MTVQNGIRSFGPEDLSLIPPRKADANKGTYGHVLVIAGSEGMCGAAYLSALAAYRTGAGLVRIFTPEPNRQILQIQLPEAIVTSYGTDTVNADREVWVKDLVEDVLEAAYVPLIIDADALNAIAEYPYLTGFYTENMILTPHVGEMARLTGKSIAELLEDPAAAAAEYRDTYGVNCVLKCHQTVTAATDGQLYRTLSGTPALAKAGTGDVLTGIIAGCLCLGMEEGQAAAFGSFLHGMAGVKAAERSSVHGVLAREVAEAVPFVMRAVPGVTF